MKEIEECLLEQFRTLQKVNDLKEIEDGNKREKQRELILEKNSPLKTQENMIEEEKNHSDEDSKSMKSQNIKKKQKKKISSGLHFEEHSNSF